MNRRQAILVFMLAAGVHPCRAQPAPRIPRVGVLGVDLASASGPVAAFNRRLAERGHVDGRSVQVVFRSAEGRPERLAHLASELAALPVDVIVATGGVPAAEAARRATRTIPIVFVAVGDPVKRGYAATLARPGGQMTGLSSVFPDTVANLVRLVRDVLPAASLVVLLVDENLPPPDETTIAAARAASAAARLRMTLLAIRSPDEFERAFEQMAAMRADAVINFGSPMILAQRRRLADVALKHRIALVGALREYRDAGALMSYGPDLAAMFAQAADYADRILRGEKPADLPIQQPTKFDLVVNRDTEKALGVTIPKAVLLRTVE